MTNWYTADPHFMHENVIPFCDRPFKSVYEMNAALLQNMHAVVRPEDELWIVGDFAFGPKAKDEAKLAKIFAQLPGAKKHLVVGNHDLGPHWPCRGTAFITWQRSEMARTDKHTHCATIQ